MTADGEQSLDGLIRKKFNPRDSTIAASLVGVRAPLNRHAPESRLI
jgi:hypothetical protein